MQQIIEQTKQYNQDNELLKIQMKLNEEPINDFNHALEQRSKAKYEAADTSIENDRLQSKINAINQNNPDDKLSSDIKSEAQSLGQLEATNDMQNELHQSIKQRRKAEFNASVERPNNELMNS